MYFSLVDKITKLTPNKEISTVKGVSLAEEYLQDHFPKFPVLPGVLMLESMTQACAWLVRASEDFAHSMVLLHECRNVKYGQFVEPGQILEVKANIIKQDERLTTFKASGSVNGAMAVSARLILERYNLAEQMPQRAASDARIRRKMKEQFEVLRAGAM